MDRVEQLRLFVRVAACRSFSQAADQLGLPRATVSVALQQLESRLGARLLHRTTRRVSLTTDGEALLERANALVADLEDLEAQFRPADGALAGRVRVDVPSRIARRVLAPALPDFFARHPRLGVDLGSTDRAVDLHQEAVDCALRVGSIATSSLVARPLGAFEMVNCASTDYLARHGLPRDPSSLGNHFVVDYASPSSGRVAPWEWVDGGTVRSVRPASQVSANNAETYIACALAGLGLIQVPRFDVVDHLAAGELVEVMPDARPLAMPVHWVYPHRRHLSRRLQAFLGWSQELLGPLLASHS